VLPTSQVNPEIEISSQKWAKVAWRKTWLKTWEHFLSEGQDDTTTKVAGI
jgi:hypothetical protein